MRNKKGEIWYKLGWLVLLMNTAFFCEERWEEAITENKAPELRFAPIDVQTERIVNIVDSTRFSYRQLLDDSVKLSLKHPAAYVFQLSYKDDNIASLYYLIEKGEGKLYQQGMEVSAALILSDRNLLELTYTPESSGTHEIVFEARDAFDKKERVKLALTVFENLPPVANVALVFKGVYNKGHYLLDASGTYDTDARWGGYPARYRYFVNGEPVGFTPNSQLEHIFQAPGRYEIGVEAIDNEGEMSEHFTVIEDLAHIGISL